MGVKLKPVSSVVMRKNIYINIYTVYLGQRKKKKLEGRLYYHNL